MPNAVLDQQHLIAANAAAGLNRLAAFEVVAAGDGMSEIRMKWDDRFTQYAGRLTPA